MNGIGAKGVGVDGVVFGGLPRFFISEPSGSMASGFTNSDDSPGQY